MDDKSDKDISIVANASGQHDDITALGEAFSFTAFHYIDIARDERLENILTRWPLLQELVAVQQENPN
ncbi:hypothetical protein NG42_04595 [Winslowiella iniecta]|uniref:Cellulose biosynthesis protein BcsR n=1 Tax=Winslowiella iniecta TaxID=1560201 RepID=A0A0L7T8C5_9GAMM|nr:hypothetical protein NG42_04595 [Winslowiella iniecta]KOC94552.1 hypothetical protein NG43_04910 [Winslowiella iniecta]